MFRFSRDAHHTAPPSHQFTRIGAPQQASLAAAAAPGVAEAVRCVADAAAAPFLEAAAALLPPVSASEAAGAGAGARVLAACMALVAGHAAVTPRSLLTGSPGLATLWLGFAASSGASASGDADFIESEAAGWGSLRALRLPPRLAACVSTLAPLAPEGPRGGALVDVPAPEAGAFCDAVRSVGAACGPCPDELPPLLAPPPAPPSRWGEGGGCNSRWSGGGGGGGGGRGGRGFSPGRGGGGGSVGWGAGGGGGGFRGGGRGGRR